MSEGTSTCFDCRERFGTDQMHPIKAPTLNGRALICDPCHIAEVERIKEINKAIHGEAINNG